MTRTSVVDHDLSTTFGLLREAHASLERQLGAELEARAGIPYGWFEVMLRISRAEGGLAPMSSLAEQVALTGGGITRMVDRMVAAGLVERVPCARDRRVVYAGLTEQGRARLAGASRVHDEALRVLLSGVSAAELAGLDEVLGQLRAARLVTTP